MAENFTTYSWTMKMIKQHQMSLLAEERVYKNENANWLLFKLIYYTGVPPAI